MSDQQPPWGKRKKPQTPEEMVAQLIKKLQDFFGDNTNKGSGGNGAGNGSDNEQASSPGPMAGLSRILMIIAFVVVAQAVFGSFFKIAPNEVGVILRFGEFTRTVTPGLHFKIPFIEDLTKVDVKNVKRREFGFSNNLNRRPGSSSDTKSDDMESLMLTADKNVINVAWIVQFRISDPYNFLFKIKDVDQAIHDLSESVTRRVVGNMDFDFVLSNRALLASMVEKELQEQLTYLESGIQLTTVQFQDVNPPDRVKPAFNEVNEADQDKSRLVNEAQEQYNRVIPAARGNAKQILQQAEGYSIERLNNASGETNRFTNILKEYKNAPQVTRQRMYLETMQDVLPSVEHIYIMDKNQQGPLPLLNLSKNALVPAAKSQ